MTTESTVEPWMTELWAWADKFDISNDNLPRNIEDLLTIIELDISGNQLTFLPESIGQLIELRQLDISDNPLITLPASLVKLKNLQYIIVDEREYEAYSTIKKNKPFSVPTEVANYLRDLGEGCIGWHYPVVAAATNPIIEALVRHGIRTSTEVRFRVKSRLIKKNVVIDKKIDREALQSLSDWAQVHADLNSHEKIDIYQLANLTHIHIISYNAPIPQAISCLFKLKGLFVHSSMSSDDDLYQAEDKLPDTIVNLTNFEALSLVCEDYDFIPTNLYKLKNLKTLEITFNNATAIPSVLSMMDCEIKLHLHSKHKELLSSLLEGLANIRHLTELSINGILIGDLR